ncbi:MAG: tetratricopeptide repeat protein [Planctomycetota bacterium]|nr:tetratricopeptide repeat protein [Planctomycetota bacterium]
MADDQSPVSQPEAEVDHEQAQDAQPVINLPTSWRDLWQLPTILLSMILITSGVIVSIKNRPKNDFDGALAQIEHLIEQNKFEAALTQLREVIEPNLDVASQAHKAKYRALVGDWFYFAQADRRQNSLANNQRIDQQYVKAMDLGLSMDAPRLERWAETLIRLGQLDRAGMQLAQLDAIDIAEGGTVTTRQRRNRIFRLLIEQSLFAPEAESTKMLALLTEYLQDDRLSMDDRAWAISQTAGIRLEMGQTREAVDHLLVDMRRLEQRSESVDQVDFGTLYTMLGRGYFDLGEYDRADVHLRHALSRLETHQPSRGDALVYLGRIAFANSDYETAFEHFDMIVREFISTHSYLPGLMGRAEVRSVLGDHDGAQEDYRRLRDQFKLEPPRRDINNQRVAESLRDRHDAALASMQLMLALEYALIADELFETYEAPSSILLRIASTSRELGNGLLANAKAMAHEDLEDRRQANLHFKRSGDFSIRYARMVALQPGADDRWADALWRGADAFDQGGWYDLAIAHFQEYIGSRSTDDPRRAEVLFRLGQTFEAQLEFENAAKSYEQVLENHPRSQFASACYVPLARSYRRLGRTSESELHLKQVIAGERFLEPDAVDFRDALIELGYLYHESEQYARAIETLNEALARYPDDSNRNSTMFRLADSYRGSAMILDRRLDSDERIAPSERERLDQVRQEQFRQAIQGYAGVCENISRKETRFQNLVEQDLVRQGYLYQADGLFHLGDYEAAIEMYDFASRKYSLHHSSMYALVQIVNCHSVLGQIKQARTAHRRALVRLEQLPPETFEASDSLMGREAWERWLENSPVAPGLTASALP